MEIIYWTGLFIFATVVLFAATRTNNLPNIALRMENEKLVIQLQSAQIVANSEKEMVIKEIKERLNQEKQQFIQSEKQANDRLEEQNWLLKTESAALNSGLINSNIKIKELEKIIGYKESEIRELNSQIIHIQVEKKEHEVLKLAEITNLILLQVMQRNPKVRLTFDDIWDEIKKDYFG